MTARGCDHPACCRPTEGGQTDSPCQGTDSLRLWEAKAHRHEEETLKAFKALSARVRQDEEEVARVRREWDELLQRDAETR